MNIILPTGRTVDSSEFVWRNDASPAADGSYVRPYTVFYQGHDLTPFLTPTQLRAIPGAEVERINFHFYALHQLAQGNSVAYDVSPTWLETFAASAVSNETAARLKAAADAAAQGAQDLATAALRGTLAATNFLADPSKPIRDKAFDIAAWSIGAVVLWRWLR